MNGKRHLALHRLTVSKRGDKLRGSEILESSVAEPQQRRLFRFHLDLLEITGCIHGHGEFDDTVRFHGKILGIMGRSEEHTSELQSHVNLVCRLLLEKKKTNSIFYLKKKKKQKHG